MPRSSSSNLHEECYYYVARLIQLKLQTSCELLLFSTGFVNSLWIGLYFYTFCVMTQRNAARPSLCDLHRACFGIEIAHFLFV